MKITPSTLRQTDIEDKKEKDDDEEDKDEGGSKGRLKVKWRAPSDHSTSDWIGVWRVQRKKKDERHQDGENPLHSSGNSNHNREITPGREKERDKEEGGSGKVWPWGRGGAFSSSPSTSLPTIACPSDKDPEVLGKCICWQFVAKGRKGTMLFSFKDRLPQWVGRYVKLFSSSLSRSLSLYISA